MTCAMKHYRLKSLRELANFHFLQDDITDKAILERLDASLPAVEAVINLRRWRACAPA